MKRAVFRSLVFNLLFYTLTAFICVIFLPTLVLPRRYFMAVVHIFVKKVYFLERYILGLDFELRGIENVPQDGSFIIAAKHQSAYETMKLHLLFKDPAVILKKELLSIPLWGMYLKKSDPIAIDRSTPETAIQSIQDGARRMKEAGRPIVIFPQGTRVNPDQSAQDKPYKIGIARLQEATDLPIIPMAQNAGMFWPRHGVFKSPGEVIFEFLKPIKPGLERSKLLSKLEKDTEKASTALMNEALDADKNGSKSKAIWGSITAVCLLVFGAYSFLWFTVAGEIKKEYPLALQDITASQQPIQEPEISGYPGKLNIRIAEESLVSDEGRVVLSNLHVQGWPIPGLPISINTGSIEIQNFKWQTPLRFDSLYALLTYNNDEIINIRESRLMQGEFIASVMGMADLKQEPFPRLDMNVQLQNHQSLLQTLVSNGIIEQNISLFMGAGLASLADDNGVVDIPLQQKQDMLYAGPLPVMKLPQKFERRQRPAVPGPAP